MSKYCLLKSYAIEYNDHSDDNHFYIHTVADDQDYSLAVNVRSSKPVTNMRYCLKEPADAAIAMLARYMEIPDGLYKKTDHPDYYLDYTIQPLFDDAELTECVDGYTDMISLEDRIRALTGESMASPSAFILAFGNLWGPKPHEEDYTFHFLPGQGIHDIHMNQNSPKGSRWAEKDRPCEDGALYFVFPDTGKIVAFYSTFNRKSKPKKKNNSSSKP